MRKILLLLLLIGIVHSQNSDNEYIYFSEKVEDTYQSEAIAYGLFDEISSIFKIYVQDSHFIYGEENLDFKINFKTASVDINLDGRNEVFVTIDHNITCGNVACNTYLLEKKGTEWKIIGVFDLITPTFISSEKKYGYYNIHGRSRSYNYECYYERRSGKYRCDSTEK